MKVHITFDVEIWCNDWSNLDARFPASFDRYIYGCSSAGNYALPKTLEILNRHGLVGVFFVEPLFSARFGRQYLDTVTALIGDAGQDIQLHLHPEWTDEIAPPIIADVSAKRQHLTYYNQDEQTALIAFGRQLLEASKGSAVQVFRAGSFAANRDTYCALARNGILMDSSLNSVYDYSDGSIEGLQRFGSQRSIEGVRVYPVTVYLDGFGRLRPAQLNGSSFAELRRALLDARSGGVQHFVIVSHNFEMLKAGTSEPDRYVVRRFEQLCAFLGLHGELFEVEAFPTTDFATAALVIEPRPRVPAWATAGRLAEQLARRFT